MKEIIILRSRDGSKNYLKKLPDKDKTYLLVTDIDSVRVSSDEEGYIFVDPSGGPMIARGAYLEEADAVIKSIYHIEGQGFSVTFK